MGWPLSRPDNSSPWRSYPFQIAFYKAITERMAILVGATADAAAIAWPQATSNRYQGFLTGATTTTLTDDGQTADRHWSADPTDMDVVVEELMGSSETH